MITYPTDANVIKRTAGYTRLRPEGGGGGTGVAWVVSVAKPRCGCCSWRKYLWWPEKCGGDDAEEEEEEGRDRFRAVLAWRQAWSAMPRARPTAEVGDSGMVL